MMVPTFYSRASILLMITVITINSVVWSLSTLNTYCRGNKINIQNLEISNVAVNDGSLRSSSSTVQLTIIDKILDSSASICYVIVDRCCLLSGDARIFAVVPIVDLLLLILLHRSIIHRESRTFIRWDDEIRQLKQPVFLMTLCSDRGEGDVPTIDSNSIVEYSIDDRIRCIERLYCTNSNDEPVDWLSEDSTCLCSLPRSIIHRYNLLHQGIGVMLLNAQRNQLYMHKRSATKRLFPSMLDMFIGGVTLSGEKPIQSLFRELKEECGIDLLTTEAKEDADDFSSRRHYRSYELDRGSKAANQLPHIDTAGSSKLAWKSAVEAAFRRYKRSIDPSNTIDTEVQIHSGTALRYVGETTISTELNHCIVHVYFLQLSDAQSNQIAFVDGEIEWGRWVSFSELNSLLEGNGQEQFVPDGLQVSVSLYSMSVQPLTDLIKLTGLAFIAHPNESYFYSLDRFSTIAE